MYVTTRAEAVQLEAQLMMGLGVSPVKGKHSVEEVIDGYIADGRTHLSAGTIDFYVKGRSALL